MLNIILLGDPASGKATQSKKLVRKYKFFELDMGVELRKLRKGNGVLGLRKVLAQTIDRGKLAPTQIVREIFKYKIPKVPKNKGIIFDGTPKMLNEAKLVSRLLRESGRSHGEVLVLYIKLPKTEIIKRAGFRMEREKGRLVKRADDNIAALNNRFKYYRVNIAAVVQYFKSKYSFKMINGMGSVAEVYSRINKAIYEFTGKKQRRNK